MSGENGTGEQPAVVVIAGEGAAGQSGEGGEIQVAGEAVAEAAVEIAAIEADRDIALAVIEGENLASANEQFAEALNADAQTEIARLQAENEECRNTISTLETAVSELTATVAQLTPPPSEPSPPSPPEEPPASAAVEDPQEAAAIQPVEEPPKPKRRPLKWI